VDTKYYCWGENPFTAYSLPYTATPRARFGRYGCDPNNHLIHLIVDKMAEEGPFDILLLNGDYDMHDVAIVPGSTTNQALIDLHFIKLWEVMTELFHHYLRKTFPDTIFLPTFGNNDVEYHYNYPTLSSDINTLYSFTGDLFFNQNPDFSSTELLELDSTFMTGGYYVVKVDGIIFISLNTLMFD